MKVLVAFSAFLFLSGFVCDNATADLLVDDPKNPVPCSVSPQAQEGFVGTVCVFSDEYLEPDDDSKDDRHSKDEDWIPVEV